MDGTSTLSLLLVALACVSVVAGVHERVIFAIDKKHGLNPSSHQEVSNKLFEFKFMDSKSRLSYHTDMFAYAQWPEANTILQKSQHPIVPQIHVPKDLSDLFENKARWKKWMVSIGMSDYIPKAVNISAGMEGVGFPVVFKSSRKQFGEGVRILHTADDLDRALRQIPENEQDTIVVEESLLGMGLQEMTSFGSAYRGTLLSLRCSLRRVNDTSQVPDQTRTSGLPFVRSNSVKWAEDHGVACGRDLVSAVSTMLSKTNYTGALCVDWKMDSRGQMKMLELNARVCGTQRKVYGDAYVISAFVPLSFAVLRGNTDLHYQERSALLHGNHSAVFHTILAMEECALRTGGGIFPSGWKAVDKFELSTPATVPLIDTYKPLFDVRDTSGGGDSAQSVTFKCPETPDSVTATSNTNQR
jgi:hypothetical protein